MALLHRIMKPKEGERVEIYKQGRLLIRGMVTLSDQSLVCITGKDHVLNFPTNELESGIASREIVVKKL